MKAFTTVLASLYFSIVSVPAQTATVPVDTDYAIKERGANHRVWQRTTYEQGPNGKSIPHVHSYTELAAGLNYQDSTGQWVESKELIEVFPAGAIARQGQQQVIFANNLNSSGAIDLQTADGKRLRSNILGLMYYDTATGEAVLIAELQDSTGELVSDNQALYPNAFNGVRADVQYTYKRSGFEQDVILREQPPAPEEFGLNSETTELEVFTEFIDPPTASVAEDQADSQGLEMDQKISWGALSLGRGKAFNIDSQDSVAVAKRYVTIQGRHFLLEKVPVKAIEKSLSKLPEQASNLHRLPYLASKEMVLPRPRLAGEPKPMLKLARATAPEKGYVMDYVTVSASYTNFTFQGNATYYISGTLNLCGTNTFEAGTVIKYAANASINIVTTPLTPRILFQTAPYLPVVFTAKDNNSYGEQISGSTGNPSGYYANPALSLQSMGAINLSEFRVSYAVRGVSVSGTSPTFYDAQFVKCSTGIADINGTVSLGNVLFSNSKTNFFATSSTNTIMAQNVTFNNAFDFIGGAYTNTTINLTNCAFVNVTNMTGTVNAGYNGFYRSAMTGASAITNTSNPLRVVGAGSCYLTNGCSFLDAGTTNIGAALLTILKQKTTYPPTVYSNMPISVTTTFSPQAPRDTNQLDFGYHYDPLDYVFGGVNVSSNLTFSSGTAIGWFELPGSGGPGYGISLPNNKSATFNGTATSPCNLARYDSVQEGGNGLWGDKGWLAAIIAGSGYDNNAFPLINAQFTHFCHLAGDPGHFRDYNNGIKVQAIHSEFYGAFGGYDIDGVFTNCLLYCMDYWQGTADPAYAWETYREIFRNCTFYGGSFGIVHWEGAPYWGVSLRNCTFDRIAFDLSPPGNGSWTWLDADFNAYNTNNTTFVQRGTLTAMPGVSNVYTASFNWQTSWLGNFYVPTNSPTINKGSTTADLVGIYHFTTQTNQVKETNSIVDIGYHYVATDANGYPIDTDGDGIPDYLEDTNGNGVFDAGDLGNWLISPYNGLSTGFGLQVFTPLK